MRSDTALLDSRSAGRVLGSASLRHLSLSRTSKESFITSFAVLPEWREADLGRERIGKRIRAAVTLRRRLDQLFLGQLRPFGDALAGFDRRPFGGIETRVRDTAADRRHCS